jgi:transposase-like protein
MPFNKLSLAEMTAECEEYVDIGTIAERLGVHNRTVERLIEEFRKKLKRWRRRGRTIEYLWADVLECAKVHMKIENDGTPSVAIKRTYTKQRIKELESEVERLTQEKIVS